MCPSERIPNDSLLTCRPTTSHVIPRFFCSVSVSGVLSIIVAISCLVHPPIHAGLLPLKTGKSGLFYSSALFTFRSLRYAPEY